MIELRSFARRLFPIAIAFFLAACSNSLSYTPAPAPLGSVSVTPGSLAFSRTGTAAAKLVAVFQEHYYGTFAERDDCDGVATVRLKHESYGATYRVVPLATGTCAATFTGGGGQTGRLSIAVSASPPGSVVLNPTLLDFTAAGSAYAQNVAVSQSNFTGSFAESADCHGIATFAVQSNAAGKAVYVVTPVGAGTCDAFFVGGGNHSAKLPVTVKLPGKVILKPSSLSFGALGKAYAKVVKVTQSFYTGAFTESDDCSGIATFAMLSGGKGFAYLTVTPVGAGSCSATVTGGSSESAKLPVSVALPGGVTLSPASLTFTATGNAHAKSVTVSQANFTGTFTERDDCGAVATVAPQSVTGPQSVWTVTPIANGSCHATFTGGASHRAVLPVSVAVPPPVPSAPNLTFHATGKGYSQTLVVKQSGFAGQFKLSDDCSGIVTIDTLSNGGGVAKYRITAVADGKCIAVFIGGGGLSAQTKISVLLPGKVRISPPSLKFKGTGSGYAQTVNVTQTRFTGAFVEKDDCSATASITAVSNGNGSAKYTVTPLAAGACTAVFTGANDQSGALPIKVVVPGGISVKPSPLNFEATGGSNAVTVTVTQAYFSGAFGETDTCSKVATFAPQSNHGPSATFLVTPLKSGICQAVFTGGNGQTFTLHVTVTQTGFGIQ